MSFLCEMKRYGVVDDFKEQMEVILLRGSGCTWGRCTYCDYQKDFTQDQMSNYKLNRKAINQVTGKFKKLFVIDSGSFVELDSLTLAYLRDKVYELGIETLIFEGHWQHRNAIPMFRKIFEGIKVEFNVGAETFDIDYREKVMKKGMGKATAKEVSKYFNRVNIMTGMKGQTLQMLARDLDLALKYFDVISLNIFTPNTTTTERDYKLIEDFYNSEIYDMAINHSRIRVIDDLNRHKTDTFDLVGEKLENIKEDK